MKKGLLLLIAVLGMLLLVACGNNKEKKGKELFEDPEVLKLSIKEAQLPITDYSTGYYSHNEVLGSVRPVITIYVNPVATDEIIDMYVEDAMIVGGFFKNDKKYLNYIRDNEPYLISFKCLDKEILRTRITGDMDSDSLKSKIKKAMEPFRAETEEKLENFYDLLSRDKVISCDKDGHYYYVIDSNNISESFDQIRGSIEELTAAYPFDWARVCEVSNSREMMYGDISKYSIYIDEYGGEKYSKINHPEQNEFEFVYESDTVFNFIYTHYIDFTYDTVKGKISIMNMLEKNAEGLQFIRTNINIEKDDKFSKDEYANALYENYVWLYNEHQKHGINQFETIYVYANEKLSGYSYEAVLQLDAYIPMDRLVPREEFDELLFKDASIYDASMYDEPDDCL